MAIDVSASPMELGLRLNQVTLSHSPPAARDKDLDTTYYVYYPSSTDSALHITLSGEWASMTPSTSALSVAVTLSGSWVESLVVAASPVLPMQISLQGDVIVELVKSNWVKWSNIGSLDFTIGRDNIAGERPLMHRGWAYALRRLDKNVVAYGENGVSLLIPEGYRWGLRVLSNVGVFCKTAICGNRAAHFFIDKKSRLCKVTDALEVLDYSEFLGNLSDPIVMSLDEELQRIFICDGRYGYVYSMQSKSLGQGPSNITGVAPGVFATYGDVESTPFEIVTDIYDLGSRKDKTIIDVELGIDATEPIYVAIDWRKDKTQPFSTTPWTRVNPNGRANLPCWGREFRFRIKQLSYEEIKLDYIKVVGQLHNYSFLDSFLRGRQV